MTSVPLRLTVRPPHQPSLASSARPGLHRIAGASRPTLVRVPSAARSGQPMPMAVMLHGSGGEPEHALQYLEPFASAAGVLLVAPASRDYTWDAVLGRSGPDAQTVGQALHWVFDRLRVDATRLVVGGFSDGATYALALGVANGDLFRAMLALSPGYIPPAEPAGRSRVFVSHGTQDTVLPIDRCSRRVVRALQEAAYEVRYAEFEGGHVIPPDIAEQACRWMLET